MIGAIGLVIIVFAGPSAFRSGLARNAVLLAGQLLTPLCIGLHDFSIGVGRCLDHAGIVVGRIRC